jgi:hypothetical protein
MLLVVSVGMARQFAGKMTESNTRTATEPSFIGKTIFLLGDVSILRGEQNYWIPAKLNMEVRSNDFVQTGPESFCEVRLRDGRVIRVGEKTLFGFDKFKPADSSETTQKRFAASRFWNSLFRLQTGTEIPIKLPPAVCAMRGVVYFFKLMAGGGFGWRPR